jgi:hypothetical protein
MNKQQQKVSYTLPVNDYGCSCGCGQHCGSSCMTDDCDCNECRCSECLKDADKTKYNLNRKS